MPLYGHGFAGLLLNGKCTRHFIDDVTKLTRSHIVFELSKRTKWPEIFDGVCLLGKFPL